MRFGGDYRRVHNDFLSSSNATGSFTFTGLFTQDPASDPSTGFSLADFLLGLPQQTGLNSAVNKSYLRDNVLDGFAQDDWRFKPSITLNYGLRYEFFAPYTEKYGRLAEVLTNPAQRFTVQSQVQSGQVGLPAFAGVSVPQSICAARWHRMESTEAKADCGSRWVWDELHGRLVRYVCNNNGSSTAVLKSTDEPGDYPDGRADFNVRANRNMPDPRAGLSGSGNGGKLFSRCALPFALRADVESRYPEDAAMGHCDECRLQRFEGKPSGYRYRSARARDQP